MMIVIQCQGFQLTPALREHVRRRLGFSLARANNHISRVDVSLSDINGPRGGIDKRCLVKVRLEGLQLVVVEDVQSNLYSAIDRAAGRAGRIVLRRLARQSDKRRIAAAQKMQRWLPGLSNQSAL